MNLNGIRTIRRGETTFIPLPKEAQRPIGHGKCQCRYCAAHPDQAPMWDTLATAAGSDYTWMVHAPEMHG